MKAFQKSVLVPCLVAPLVASLPAVAADEVYACQVIRQCDSAGKCLAASGDVTFALTARKVKRDGEGEYALAYGGKTVRAWAASEIGPLMWEEGRNDMHLLTLTSSVNVLWQKLDIAKDRSEIRFMQCE